jgi:hypothetical protein
MPAIERIVAFSLGSEEIDFSIVIPAYDRPERLGRCLAVARTLAGRRASHERGDADAMRGTMREARVARSSGR